MKRQCLILLATVAAMIIGLGSLASVQGSDIVLSIPGITIVQDAKADLLLRNCNPSYPGIPCSLFPTESPTLPGYFDIKNAKIVQHGSSKYVDMFIALYAPIPAEPPYSYGFVNYFWQFQGGCTVTDTGKKAGVSVIWSAGEWKANWYVIRSCGAGGTERVVEPGDPITSFEFTSDGVKVRVTLEDLESALDPNGQLMWHAGARQVPFVWPNPCGGNADPNCWNTAAVDYAPDVFEFIDCDLPPVTPCIWKPESPASWEPK